MITCHVIYADVFGNLFTDLTEDRAVGLTLAAIEVGGAVIQGLSDNYSAAPEGGPLALFGSSGQLEIAVRNGSARRVLGVEVGGAVTVRTHPGTSADPPETGRWG